MNDLRKKIMEQLDQLIGAEQNNLLDLEEHYDEIVDNLEALVVGYSVDVTSDTLSDIAAVRGKLEGYELQENNKNW